MHFHGVFVMVASLCLTPAIDKLTEAQKTELKQFVGNWEYKEVIREGKKREAHWLEDLTVEFAENGCYMVKHKSGVVALGRITVDPTKSPKQMDLTLSTRSEYDGKLRGVTEVIGIYEIDKKTIRMCFNIEGNPGPRPTKFSSNLKEATVLEVLHPYQWKEATPNTKK